MARLAMKLIVPLMSGMDPLAPMSAHSGASDAMSPSMSAANSTSAAISLAAARVSASAARNASRFTVTASPTEVTAARSSRPALSVRLQLAREHRLRGPPANDEDQEARDRPRRRVEEDAGREGGDPLGVVAGGDHRPHRRVRDAVLHHEQVHGQRAHQPVGAELGDRELAREGRDDRQEHEQAGDLGGLLGECPGGHEAGLAAARRRAGRSRLHGAASVAGTIAEKPRAALGSGSGTNDR